jgi:protease II
MPHSADVAEGDPVASDVSAYVHHPELQVILPHSADVKIEGASIGARWLVVQQRSRAQQSVVLHQLPSNGSMPQQLAEGQTIQFEEAAYALSGGECDCQTFVWYG